MPVFGWQAAKFLMPALYPHEKSFIAKLVLPATLLFVVGAVFSYFVFTPIAMDFFFSFSDQLGVGIPDPTDPTQLQPTIAVGSFLSWVTLMVLAFGVIFELPVFMAGISYLGLVSAQGWYNGWRYALIAFLIIGGIITPDASGLTQLLVAVPMFGLYMGGVAVALLVERKERDDAS
jgi:sec-independent protein translocase protein TatC